MADDPVKSSDNEREERSGPQLSKKTLSLPIPTQEQQQYLMTFVRDDDDGDDRGIIVGKKHKTG